MISKNYFLIIDEKTGARIKEELPTTIQGCKVSELTITIRWD